MTELPNEFVDVRVDATGYIQRVPAHFLDDPRLGVGLTPLEPNETAPVQPPVAAASEVELVAGTEGELPHIPAVQEAIAAQREQAAEAVDAEPPTESSSHAEIDAYAAAHGIDMGEAKTRAEKVAAITSAEDQSEQDTTDTGDDQSSGEHPDAGDEEN